MSFCVAREGCSCCDNAKRENEIYIENIDGYHAVVAADVSG